MSTYIISDIHGCNTLFRKALKKISLKKSDVLIILGDLIDRGNDSKGVLDTVFLLKEHNFNIICITGNHEQMLIDSYEDISTKINWLKNGGKETLKSFLVSEIERIPLKYLELIKSFNSYYTLDNYIFVHAGLNMMIDNPFSDIKSLLWLRDWEKVYNQKWLGNKIVIHGHTPITRENILKNIKSKKQVIGIDNGSYMKGTYRYGSICVLKLDDLSVHFEKRIGNESIEGIRKNK